MNNKRLILLTSGWSKPDLLWSPMATNWKEQGYDVICAGYPARGFTSIQRSAKHVARTLGAVADLYGHITFVGHSMGGLIGRYIIQRLPEGRSVDTYVSIGTPHQGTVLGYLAPWSKSARQMTPNSEFIKKLEELPWPNIPTLSVGAGLEEVVVPRSSAEFSHSNDHITIPGATHGSIILDSRAFWEIWAFLTFTVFGESGKINRKGFVSGVRK